MVLKKFLNNATKNALIDSAKSSTAMILNSLKRFLNNGTKKIS